MSENVTVSLDQTEEFHCDYYVNEHGIKMLYRAEEVDSTYLAELREDCKAILGGEVELVSSDKVMLELCDLGLDR